MKFKHGKYLFHPVIVKSNGDVVIPSAALRAFGIKPGNILFVGGDLRKGIGFSKSITKLIRK